MECPIGFGGGAIGNLTNGEGPGVMDEAAVARFVQHYERLTRPILHEMPGGRPGAQLSADRSCRELGNAAASPQNLLPTADLSTTVKYQNGSLECLYLA